MNIKTWLAAATLTLAAAHSSATVERYAFTATISSLWEYDKAGRVITHVNTSTFAGGALAMTDLVQGTMAFNTHAPLSPYQPAPPTSGTFGLYQLDSADSGITFKVGTLSFQSGSTLAPIAQVSDNASTRSGWDTFSISAYKKYDPVMFQDSDIMLFDKTGTAFNTAALPAHLDLSWFHYAVVSGAWVRQADGNQMHFDATITSLQALAPVPEPSSGVLMLAGMLGVAVAALRGGRWRHGAGDKSVARLQQQQPFAALTFRAGAFA